MKITAMRILAISIIAVLALVLCGCDVDGDATPKIVGKIPPFVGTSVYTPPKGPAITYGDIPAAWYPPQMYEKSWKAIVIHHSATDSGNSVIFDDWHRNGNNWQGVGYDFVIGNGNKCPNGHVEVTFRWQQQIQGAHVGGTPNNWANVDAIGICLVGDFNKTAPTDSQMRSLAKLIRFLQKRYNIPTSGIYGHRDTPGYTGGTDCPGRKFPMAQLKQML